MLINLILNLYSRVLGVVVLTVGVYAVLWGKHVDDISEELYREDNTVLEAVKCCSRNSGLSIMPKIKEPDEDVETGKFQATEKESSLAVMVFCSENVNNDSRF